MSRRKASIRTSAENIGLFYVRNNAGQKRAALRASPRIEHRTGPEFIMRYNEYPLRANQRHAPRPVTAPRQAIRALEEVFAQTMPREMGFDYLGMSFQEQEGGARRFAVGRSSASRCSSSS